MQPFQHNKENYENQVLQITQSDKEMNPSDWCAIIM
jgi:hypothetical protein